MAACRDAGFLLRCLQLSSSSLFVPTQRQTQTLFQRAKKAWSKVVRQVLASWCKARVNDGKTREQTAAEQLYRVQRLLGDAVKSQIAAIDDRRA